MKLVYHGMDIYIYMQAGKRSSARGSFPRMGQKGGA